jgi:hypothetical protein
MKTSIDLNRPSAAPAPENKAMTNDLFETSALAALTTLIWAIGMSALLIRLLHQTMAVRRRVDQASDLFDADWSDQRDAVAKQIGVRVNVALKRHPEALSPMVIGLLQPVVLLPGDSDTWPKERRRQVLLHELAHPLFVGFEEGKHEEGRLLPDQYEFRLQKGRQLSGRVVDEEGKPISNAKVQVSISVDEPPGGAHPTPVINTWLAYGDKAAVTNQDGHWEISNAPAPPEQGKALMTAEFCHFGGRYWRWT